MSSEGEPVGEPQDKSMRKRGGENPLRFTAYFFGVEMSQDNPKGLALGRV